jgi:hypothetical protein
MTWQKTATDCANEKEAERGTVIENVIGIGTESVIGSGKESENGKGLVTEIGNRTDGHTQRNH